MNSTQMNMKERTDFRKQDMNGGEERKPGFLVSWNSPMLLRFLWISILAYQKGC